MVAKRKAKSSRRRAQAPSPTLKRIQRELSDTKAYENQLRKELKAAKRVEAREKRSRASAEKRRKTKRTSSDKARIRAGKKASRERKATVREIHELNHLVNIGIYAPKVQKRGKGNRRVYTKGQVRSARKAAKKKRHLLEKKHIYVVVSPETRRAYKRAGVETTHKAVAIPDLGYEKVEARVRHGKPEIVVIEKKRPGRRRKTTIYTAVNTDDMQLQTAHIERRFVELQARAVPGARVRFYVDGEFGSTRTYSAAMLPQFMADISRYRHSRATLFQFRNNLKIELIPPAGNQFPRNKRDWNRGNASLFQAINATNIAAPRGSSRRHRKTTRKR